MNEIKAIETVYNGHRFRSRLEARWAVFFDALMIKWEYEPEGYKTPDGNYLPDFLLPDAWVRSSVQGVFFEVKPPGHEDMHWPLWYVADQLDKGAMLAVGFDFMGSRDDEGLYQIAPWWDYSMTLYVCSYCRRTKFEFTEGSYMNCDGCQRSDYEYSQHLLEAAHDTARSYRFW